MAKFDKTNQLQALNQSNFGVFKQVPPNLLSPGVIRSLSRLVLQDDPVEQNGEREKLTNITNSKTDSQREDFILFFSD